MASVPELIAAAEDAFVEGIRIALASGLVLCLLAFVAAFVVIPRGTRAQQRTAETNDATQLRAKDPAKPSGQ